MANCQTKAASAAAKLSSEMTRVSVTTERPRKSSDAGTGVGSMGPMLPLGTDTLCSLFRGMMWLPRTELAGRWVQDAVDTFGLIETLGREAGRVVITLADEEPSPTADARICRWWCGMS